MKGFNKKERRIYRMKSIKVLLTAIFIVVYVSFLLILENATWVNGPSMLLNIGIYLAFLLTPLLFIYAIVLFFKEK